MPPKKKAVKKVVKNVPPPKMVEKNRKEDTQSDEESRSEGESRSEDESSDGAGVSEEENPENVVAKTSDKIKKSMFAIFQYSLERIYFLIASHQSLFVSPK